MSDDLDKYRRFDAAVEEWRRKRILREARATLKRLKRKEH